MMHMITELILDKKTYHISFARISNHNHVSNSPSYGWQYWNHNHTLLQSWSFCLPMWIEMTAVLIMLWSLIRLCHNRTLLQLWLNKNKYITLHVWTVSKYSFSTKVMIASVSNPWSDGILGVSEVETMSHLMINLPSSSSFLPSSLSPIKEREEEEGGLLAPSLVFNHNPQSQYVVITCNRSIV